MEISETQKKTVDLLMENEVAMRELYLEFSKRFNLYETFWRDIAGEEESHAAWINTLYNKMGAGLVEFSEKRFPMGAITENIRYMREAMEKTRKGEISLLEALEKAVHIENGMLEKKFFEVFKDDSMELQIILEALRLGTQQHLREVKRVWDSEKLGSSFESEKE